MSNLTEVAQWEPGIYQLEESDVVQGGPDGIDNVQAKQLANRTAYLKGLVDGLGDGKQPLDATLTALAAIVTVADKLIYATAADTFATTTLTAFARTLLDDIDAATARTTLGLGTAAVLASDTDGTLATNSDTRVPSQKAVKTYVDSIIAAQDAMVFKGIVDCSANPNYPAADRGHTYRVSVAGKIGGAAGVNVEAGDILICLTDATAAGNQATVGAAWGVIQANLDGALLTTAIGSTVQAYDADLAAIAALVSAADKFPYATGAGTWALTGLTAFGRTLLDDVDAASARSTLGIWFTQIQQTVLASPVDANGLPSFLPATSATLSIASQNIAAGAPLIVAAANGFNSSGALDRIGISTANLAWAGLTANATNYLYVDVAESGTLTPGRTTVAPIYQQGGNPAVAANQATFNIAQMQMFVGNGATAPQAYRVFIGEAVTNAATVTSTVAYALMGRYVTGRFAVATNTAYSKNHNLGVEPRRIRVFGSETAGGALAEPIMYWYSDGGHYLGVRSAGKLNLILQTGTYQAQILAAGGSVATAVEALVIVERGW